VAFAYTLLPPLTTPDPRRVNRHGKSPVHGYVQPENAPLVRVPATAEASFCSSTKLKVELAQTFATVAPSLAVKVPDKTLAVVPSPTSAVRSAPVNRVSADAVAAGKLAAKTARQVSRTRRRMGSPRRVIALRT
jgi:hypothetical protein